MTRNLLTRLRQRGTLPVQPPLVVALEEYEQALTRLSSNAPQTLLPVLLARDKVKVVLEENQRQLGGHFEKLVVQDAKLRQEMANLSLDELHIWRQSRQPHASDWWWFLDQTKKEEAEQRAEQRAEQLAEQRANKALPWQLGSIILLMVIIPLAVELITRLWNGGEDVISVFVALLTLVLTSGTLTEWGSEFIERLLERLHRRIPRLNRLDRHEVFVIIAFFAIVVLFIGRVVGIPWWAKYRNRQGLEALLAGNLTDAQQYFESAVALSPGQLVLYEAEEAVGFYHLANVYEEMAHFDEAIKWYQRALEEDSKLGVAYNNLGRLHILQENPKQAVRVLEAGLGQTPASGNNEAIVRYRLFSNLGWAYHVLKQPTHARKALEQAIELEEQLEAKYHTALPHYYLAISYETLNQPNSAGQQWQESLRYPDSDIPDDIDWLETARTHLYQLRKESP